MKSRGGRVVTVKNDFVKKRGGTSNQHSKHPSSTLTTFLGARETATDGDRGFPFCEPLRKGTGVGK